MRYTLLSSSVLSFDTAAEAAISNKNHAMFLGEFVHFSLMAHVVLLYDDDDDDDDGRITIVS